MENFILREAWGCSVNSKGLIFVVVTQNLHYFILYYKSTHGMCLDINLLICLGWKNCPIIYMYFLKPLLYSCSAIDSIIYFLSWLNEYMVFLFQHFIKWNICLCRTLVLLWTWWWHHWLQIASRHSHKPAVYVGLYVIPLSTCGRESICH